MKKHPYIYTSAEALGAAMMPLKYFKASKYAPLARHNQNRWYNAFVNTGLATIGLSDFSNPLDIATALATAGGGNAIGTAAANTMLGRGLGNTARTGYDFAGNLISGTVSNWLKNKFE